MGTIQRARKAARRGAGGEVDEARDGYREDEDEAEAGGIKHAQGGPGVAEEEEGSEGGGFAGEVVAGDPGGTEGGGVVDGEGEDAEEAAEDEESDAAEDARAVGGRGGVGGGGGPEGGAQVPQDEPEDGQDKEGLGVADGDGVASEEAGDEGVVGAQFFGPGPGKVQGPEGAAGIGHVAQGVVGEEEDEGMAGGEECGKDGGAAAEEAAGEGEGAGDEEDGGDGVEEEGSAGAAEAVEEGEEERVADRVFGVPLAGADFEEVVGHIGGGVGTGPGTKAVGGDLPGLEKVAGLIDAAVVGGFVEGGEEEDVGEEDGEESPEGETLGREACEEAARGGGSLSAGGWRFLAHDGGIIVAGARRGKRAVRGWGA